MLGRDGELHGDAANAQVALPPEECGDGGGVALG